MTNGDLDVRREGRLRVAGRVDGALPVLHDLLLRILAAGEDLVMQREAAIAKVRLGETALAEVLAHTVVVDTPLAVPA